MKLLSDEKLSVVNVLHAYSSLPYQIVRDGGLMVYVDILTWFKSFCCSIVMGLFTGISYAYGTVVYYSFSTPPV
jgi:hypothetical protein